MIAPATSTLTIRKLDRAIKDRLRLRAAKHRRSMEEEARTILRDALAGDDASDAQDLGSSINGRFKALGGVDLDVPARSAPRDPPKLR